MSRFHAVALLALGLPLVISGCGDGGGSHSSPPPAATTPDPTTTLSVSVSALALSINQPLLNAALTGNPRFITVTNAGSEPASAVQHSATGLPPDTSVTSNCSGTLAAGGSCTITVTPGANPSAAPGDIAPQSALLEIAGSNTNTVSVRVDVLSYGSVYQGGYIFAIDDSTPASGGIGGKVAALADLSTSIAWDDSATPVGVDELSTTPCAGNSDGACNTQAMMDLAPASVAHLCVGLTAGGYVDWYLPAICELGYDGTGSGTGCGNASSPAQQNMQSSLLDAAAIAGLSGFYWSSTEYSGWANFAFGQGFDSASQVVFSKPNLNQVRCARALTY